MNRIDSWFREGGKIKISESDLSTYDINLLRFSPETVDEHQENHAAALLYYSTILEVARRRLSEAKERFKQQLNLMRNNSSKILMKSGGRPSVTEIKADMEARYPLQLKKHRDDIRKLENIFKEFELWLNAWEKKGFLFNSYKSNGAVKYAGNK